MCLGTIIPSFVLTLFQLHLQMETGFSKSDPNCIVLILRLSKNYLGHT